MNAIDAALHCAAQPGGAIVLFGRISAFGTDITPAHRIGPVPAHRNDPLVRVEIYLEPATGVANPAIGLFRPNAPKVLVIGQDGKGRIMMLVPPSRGMLTPVR